MKKFILYIVILALISTVLISAKYVDVQDNYNKDYVKSYYNLTHKIISVPIICQYPDLPTGCEAVSATMVLQYYGVDITSTEFATNWLECSDEFYFDDSILYGPNPNEVFAGNPFSENSYGCYASPIVSAINENSTQCEAKQIKDETLESLCKKYIDNDKPMLIWATMGMKKSKKGQVWRLPNGNKFIWISGEHCLVLVGYNDDYYIFNDPQYEHIFYYKKEIAQKRFEELGEQAVLISKKD